MSNFITIRKELIFLFVFLLPMALTVHVSHAAFSSEYTFSGSESAVTYGKVVWADLNGDGYEDLIGNSDDLNDSNSNGKYGKVYALNVRTGTKLWEFSPSPAAVIYSTPAVGDVDGDGAPEVIFGVGNGIGSNTQSGGVYILSSNGGFEAKLSTLDFDGNGYPDGVYSSPALGDLDRDGIRDIVFGSYDQRVYAYRYNQGTGQYEQYWSFHTGDTIHSSPALANIDSDPYLEVMIGIPIHWEDSTANTDFVFDVRYDGGMMLVLNHDGTMHGSFLNKPGDPKKPKTFVTQTVRSSPAVADIDGDGYLEIVHATSAYRGGFHGRCSPSDPAPDPSQGVPFPTSIPEPRVYAWNHDGTLAWQTSYLGSLPSSACDSTVINDSENSPAIGNLDGDNYLEVVVGQRSKTGTGKIFIIDGSNGSFQNSFQLRNQNGASPSVGIRSSPVIFNADSDSTLEAASGILNSLMIYTAGGYNGGTYSDSNSYINIGSQITYQVAGAIDYDKDGKVEVGIIGKDGVFKVYQQTAVSTDNPWPMFRQNQFHTGLYDTTSPAAVSDLTATKINDTDVQLNWTSTGHNGNTGCAFYYEVRYMSGSVFNWDTATPVSGVPLPQVSGTPQSMIIYNAIPKGNKAAYLMYAMKVYDEANNASSVSNTAYVDITVPTLPPAAALFLILLISMLMLWLRRREVAGFTLQ